MVCLKGIPRNLSPELLQTLAQMGHGDEIGMSALPYWSRNDRLVFYQLFLHCLIAVLADVNFPSSSVCRHGPKELRADGQNIPELLKSILQLFPLEQYDPKPVLLMDLEPQDKLIKLGTPIWEEYKKIIQESGELRNAADGIGLLARAKKAYAVVHTSEPALYANIILKKGVIP
jgi:L-fucose mutarotase